MSRVLALFALTFGLALPAKADPVVVELFTSQGCSSCPRADAMLGELAERADVIALSLHVDYWDWIGWEDTFADPVYSERQRAYATVAGATAVYTPQFVVAGQHRIAGPKGMKLADAIATEIAAGTPVLSYESGRLHLSETSGGGELYIIEVTPRSTVEILRGENAGRAVTYHQIVRSWTALGSWDGSAGSMDLPAASDPALSRIVLVQQVDSNGGPGPIFGAVRAD